MQPGRELNPFAHKPTHPPTHPAPVSLLRLSPWTLRPPPLHANTNENTSRPSVISLFTIPTVISGHGNGILVHDQGSPDTPLTLLPKTNTCQLLVLSLRCFARRNLNVFDKGKRLGIYLLKLGCQAALPDATYRGQCGSKLPCVASDFHRPTRQHFRTCLFCHEGISQPVQSPPLTRECYPSLTAHTQAGESVHVRSICTINQ